MVIISSGHFIHSLVNNLIMANMCNECNKKNHRVYQQGVTKYEPRHERTCFLNMQKQGPDQLRGNREADQCLCFHYIDSTIPLLSKYKILSLYPSSVAVQPGLCGTWSETPKTGFLMPWLILSAVSQFCHFNLVCFC